MTFGKFLTHIRDLVNQAVVVGLDQSWLKKDLNIMNIIMVLILFYGNVFHYYIHDVIIIKQTYGSSIQSTRKFRVQPLAGEPEKNVIRNGSLENV